MHSQLALNGGTPLSTRPWPLWPQYSPELPRQLAEVAGSGRWSISGPYAGTACKEQELATMATSKFKCSFCIPTDHGSSGLVLAMRALNVQPGSEVIIPGLTWVACASTVARLGAYPVMVDIESNTQCMDPVAIEAAISTKTSAIMVVHLNSCLANLDKIIEIARKHSLPIIEDCSQCHGATWNESYAGTLGDVGVFSLHHGKLVTCGEGGLVITNNENLSLKIQQLRADGRRYREDVTLIGQQHLEEFDNLVGCNFALSEFAAQTAINSLMLLTDLNNVRQENAMRLDSELSIIEGLDVVKPHPANKVRAYYHYVVRIDRRIFPDANLKLICDALTAELGLWIHPTYAPLNSHKLYRPLNDLFYKTLLPDTKKLDPSRFYLPESDNQSKNSILIHHSALLSSADGINEIIQAFKKVISAVNNGWALN